MKKNSRIFICFVTVSFVIAMVAVVMHATKDVQRQTEDSCFSSLQEATQGLADEFNKAAEMDQMILNAMSSVIASENDPTESRLCAIMRSYDNITSYISYVEMLRPDNTMLDNDGTVRDVNGLLDFEEEAQKGSYVSEMTWSTKDPDERIVRNAVPVIEDGKTSYILYGVVRLSDLKELFTTDIYDGHAYVYVIDGKNGDMILDTWHNTYGNMSDFEDRECLSEDDFADAKQNMRQNKSGSLSFLSQSTGDTLYMYYEPIGINGWFASVTIQDRYAFSTSIHIQSTMRQMAVIIAVVVILYLAFVILVMVQAYRRIQDVGLNDKITGLQNRNAYDAYLSRHRNTSLPSAACVYIDVNGLHELNNREGHAAGDRMLSHVAEELKREFPLQTIYRVGGDEFVIVSAELNEAVCREKVQRVSHALEQKGYSIAYGIAVQENTTGYTEVIYQADEKMLKNKKNYYLKHDRRMR